MLAKRAEPGAGAAPEGASLRYFGAESRARAPRAAAATLLRTAFRRPRIAASALAGAFRSGDYASLQALAARDVLDGPPYDIVHCEFGPLGNVGLLVHDLGFATGPVATSFRGSDISSYLARKPRAYELLKQRGDLFLPVCAPFAERLAALGFPRGRVRVYRSAIDTASIPYRERPAEAPSAPLLMAAGRFVEKKGFSHAIRVLGRLSTRFPAARLVIVGDGPLRARLEAEARAEGLMDRIELPGWLPHAEALALMGKADLFLGTSVAAASGDVEGIPNVLKEAMAAGAPVVAFDHSGVSDLVVDGETGFLVAEGDESAMADRAARILARDGSAAGMGARARRAAEDGYSLEGQAAAAEALYEEAVAAYRAAGGKEARA